MRIEQLILVLELSLALLSCAPAFSDINSSLKQFAEDPSATSFSFATRHTGEWDTLCILGPYTNQTVQDQVLGFHTDLIASADDGATWLVFVNDHKVRAIVAHPRNKTDFVSDEGKCYARDSTTFEKVVSSPSGFVSVKHL